MGRRARWLDLEQAQGVPRREAIEKLSHAMKDEVASWDVESIRRRVRLERTRDRTRDQRGAPEALNE